MLPNRRILILIVLLFIVRFSNGQQIGLTLPADSSYAVLVFDEYNSLMTIPVTVNGKKRLRFIVDTGVEHTILTNKSLGDELGLSYLRKMPLVETSDGTIYGHAAHQLNIELAGGVMSGDNHSMMVLDYDYLGLSSLAQVPVYGLIGRDIFSRFIVEIDHEKNFIVLHRQEAFQIPNGYEEIPLKFIDGKPHVSVSSVFQNWDELTEDYALKTGAPHTILYDSKDNIFHVPPRKIETILGRGNAGEVTGQVGRVREVKIGKFIFENPIASFTDKQIEGVNRNSVGMGFLGRFNMIVDFNNAKLYLKPNRDYNDSFEFDMSGIRIAPSGEKFVISYVLPDSPAEEAGIKEGDQVISIEGELLTTENLNEITSVFSSKPKKKVTLTVIRDGQEKEISFRLVRFI